MDNGFYDLRTLQNERKIGRKRDKKRSEVKRQDENGKEEIKSEIEDEIKGGACLVTFSIWPAAR